MQFTIPFKNIFSCCFEPLKKEQISSSIKFHLNHILTTRSEWMNTIYLDGQNMAYHIYFSLKLELTLRVPQGGYGECKSWICFLCAHKYLLWVFFPHPTSAMAQFSLQEARIKEEKNSKQQAARQGPRDMTKRFKEGSWSQGLWA